jgi:lysophospholipase L1-like esterase
MFQSMNFTTVRFILIVGLIFICFSTIIPAQETVQLKPDQSKNGSDPALPNVLILGDSISIGYTPFVREMLKDKANVWRPAENCGNTKIGLRNLERWLDTKQINGKKWDVIHFNWGLWDLTYRYPQNQDNKGERTKTKGGISFTPEQYGENIEKIVVRLEKTGAKLIWGNISFVPEGEGARVFGDDLVFNKVAEPIMERHHIPINNINALTRTFEPKLMVAPGNVHYTNEGYRKIAKQVADIIEQQLIDKIQ